MALRVQFVTDFSQTVEPAVEFLQQPSEDVFSTSHIIVPTAGARMWLLAQLSQRLGASTGRSDGVVANVRVGYIGMLRGFVSPQSRDHDDPWSIDHLTHVVLKILVGDQRYKDLCTKLGGPLQAARMLADRFDRYSARRPSMIRAWENNSPVFAPSSADAQNDTEWRPSALGDHQWQYDLWRRVRENIGVPMWPTLAEQLLQEIRQGKVAHDVPSRILLLGQQSLTISSLEVMQALGHVSDIDAYLVHPSPALAHKWAQEFADVTVTPSVLPLRPQDADIPDDVDPLMHSWLRSSREMQHMFASQNVPYELHPSTTPHLDNTVQMGSTLLGRIQHGIKDVGVLEKLPLAPSDVSVQIHRCYDLSRQVEVLHDALLHAFRTIENLQPHDVVILSPQIDECAPLLEAVFQREVPTSDGQKVRIPLVVADRSLRQVSNGSQMLSDLLALLQGRFSIDEFMKVVSSDLVTQHLLLSDEDLNTWQRCIDKTQVRWGLSAQHRTALGLRAPNETAHTWQLAIERAILGATMPDSDAVVTFGGVTPLPEVDTEEIEALSTLAFVLGVLAKTEQQLHLAQSVSFWCDLVEDTLTRLCGTEHQDLARPLAAVEQFRRATSVPMKTLGELQHFYTKVDFADFVGVMSQHLEGAAGYQPLRTGAVTATSFIPLRGLPYRVVCVVGFDDGAFGNSEGDSDDLVSVQQFIGDDDIRIDNRRAFLDAVLSAQEQLIITCMGRSILNNSSVPLTTALAEFVDLCKRAGVQDRASLQTSPSIDPEVKGTEIEYFHPRHFSSPRNFLPNGIVNRGPQSLSWSHNTSACALAGVSTGDRGVSEIAGTISTPEISVVELYQLEQFVINPLRVFTRNVMGISTWREKAADEGAILPLSLTSSLHQGIASQFMHGYSGTLPHWDESQFVLSLRANGQLPIGVFADDELDEIKETARNFADACRLYGISVAHTSDTLLSIDVGSGRVVNGVIGGYQPDNNVVSIISQGKKHKNDHLVLALRLLALVASGNSDVTAFSVHLHNDKPNEPIVRVVKLNDNLDMSDAQERLGTLVDLFQQAHRGCYPAFGEVARNLTANPNDIDFDKHASAFTQHVNTDWYPDSDEAVVYGLSPRYDTVFAPDSDVVNFWKKLSGVYRIVGKTEGATFEKSSPRSRSVVW